MRVMQCDACAGSVAYDAKNEVAACIFCGSIAVRPCDLALPIRPPDDHLPFCVDRARATESFAAWARSSWWHPRELRNLSVQLRDAMLPAWRLDADVETHWAALKSAPTKSGARPVSGVARTRESIMVPASLGLTSRELLALEPFQVAEATPWGSEPNAPSVPMELPSVSQRAAADTARALLCTRHCKAIAAQHGLKQCRGSSLAEIDTTRLLMLPIWIGSFRYRDLPWRFVVNAQTGRVTGRAPIDRVKVAATVLIAAAVAVLVAWVRQS